MVPSNASLTTLTRIGFAARGLLYLVVAVVMLRSGQASDLTDALGRIGEGGGGLVLTLIIVGFVGYGIWRLADAALNVEGHEPGGKGVRERLGAAGSGLVHLSLAWQAIRLLQGDGASGGGTDETARDAMNLPGGELLLTLVGLVLIGVGLFQFVKAAKAKFLEKLDARVADEDWVKLTGRIGYSARGVVFAISGWFLLRAGLDSDPSQAGGMDRALSWLDPPWSIAVGVGLLLFGLFSLVEARFRRIHRVPIEGLTRPSNPMG